MNKWSEPTRMSLSLPLHEKSSTQVELHGRMSITVQAEGVAELTPVAPSGSKRPVNETTGKCDYFGWNRLYGTCRSGT